MGKQYRADRHPAAASKNLTKNLNMIVMECYYRSRQVSETRVPSRGNRKIIYSQWKIKGIFESPEQRICDQARAIKKNGWLYDVELEAIRRNIEKEDNLVNNMEIREKTDHHDNLVKLNQEKTTQVVISRTHHQNVPLVFMNGHILDISSSFTQLGLLSASSNPI